MDSQTTRDSFHGSEKCGSQKAAESHHTQTTGNTGNFGNIGNCGNIDDEYFAGLLDASLTVHATKNPKKDTRIVRVTLVCDDERVLTEIRDRVVPVRETIIRRPGKKDACVALLGPDCTKVLEFAVEKCVLRKDLARAALGYLAGDATAEQVAEAQAQIGEGDVSVPWVSGFFDVRGVISPAKSAPPENTADEPQKRRRRSRKARGVVKIVLPKSEKSVIPRIRDAIQSGKIKKSAPCRLTFDNADLDSFVSAVGKYVRVKRAIHDL